MHTLGPLRTAAALGLTLALHASGDLLWPSSTDDQVAVLFAQATGEISGVVQDEDGSPMDDRTVQLERPERGRLVITTGSAGTFRVLLLHPMQEPARQGRRVRPPLVETSEQVTLTEDQMEVSGIILTSTEQSRRVRP